MPEGSASHLIVVICIGVVCSAFFSAAATALLSMNKIRLRAMTEAGVKGAKTVDMVTRDVKKLRGVTLVLDTAVKMAVGAALVALSGGKAGLVGAVVGVTAFLLMLFCAAISKAAAAKNIEGVSVLAAPFILCCLFVLTPLTLLLDFVTGLIISIPNADKAEAPPLITETELKTMVDVGHEEGVIEDSEKKMIDNVFEFGDNTAADVMTPRTEIVSLPLEATAQTVMALFKKEYFSRVPIYKEDMDHIVGILHLKDFIFGDHEHAGFNLEELMRTPFFSYESKPTSKLFAEMRTDGIAMAIILDEYGGTQGLVSIQDLIEEIVGDISDEYDEDEIVSVREDEYIVDGGTKIEDFNELSGTNLTSEDYESLGGFVIELLGAIPEQGTDIEFEDLEGQMRVKFIIEEMDKNRIVKIRTIITRDTVTRPHSEETGV